MAEYKELEKDEIKFDVYQTFISGSLESFYALYDEDIDSFVVKIVKPDSVVIVYHLDDGFALLIDSDTKQVVGLQYFKFQADHLPKNKEMEDIWYKHNLAEHFSQYRKGERKQKVRPVRPVPIPKKRMPEYVYRSAGVVLTYAIE